MIYGRRRLGKTTLLKEFVKDIPHCYYLSDRAGEKLQIKALSAAIATCIDEPLIENIEYNSWYELFEAFDRFRNVNKNFIFIIDEFQYLCQTQHAFSSFIQKLSFINLISVYIVKLYPCKNQSVIC